MKAVVCTRYGPPDVLKLEEVERPTPKDNELLVRVHATTVARGDCELRGLEVPLLFQLILRMGFGFRGPRRGILGQELAGEVESVGKDVKLFKQGDQVFALTGLHLGAYAEYDCPPEKGLVAIKPSNMTYEEAAALPVGGLHAIHCLAKVSIQSGLKVLIVGAGGSIGTLTVQITKSFGAEVTGVDSGTKLDIVRSIGADHVIDYTGGDFTKSGQTYDIIFDTIGKSSFSACIRCLNPRGLYLLGNPSLSQIVRPLSSRSGKKMINGSGSYNMEDLVSLIRLAESGKIRPVIDRRYPLEQIVEAHRYVDTGEKKGNVVVTVSSQDED